MHEDGLEPVTRRQFSGQPYSLALLVFIDGFRRPIGGGKAMADQAIRANAHHLAKSRVDIGGQALHVARPQTGQQGILHGFAKSQRLGQIALYFESAPRVLTQQGQHEEQRKGHTRHQGRQHVGKEFRRAAPLVHTQHQIGPRQINQLLCGKDTTATAGWPAHHQTGAIALREGRLPIGQSLTFQQVVQHLLQGECHHQVTRQLTTFTQWQAQFHHIHAQAIS